MLFCVSQTIHTITLPGTREYRFQNSAVQHAHVDHLPTRPVSDASIGTARDKKGTRQVQALGRGLGCSFPSFPLDALASPKCPKSIDGFAGGIDG